MTCLPDDDDVTYVELMGLPTHADLVGELRVFNDAWRQETTPLWALVVDKQDSPDWGVWPSVWLDAGAGGSDGALRWVDADGTFIPADGLARLSEPDVWMPYFDWSGTPFGLHVAARAPIELVFAAVAELVQTRRRPTCLDWAPVEHTRLVGSHPGMP